MKRTLLACSIPLALTGPLYAAEMTPGELAFSGDVRLGYFALDRDDRDGTSSDRSDWRIRLRPGVQWQATSALSAKLRFAGRYSTDDSNENHAEFFTSIPQPEGLRFGDATVDELYLRYQPARAWEITLGRMQTKFELEGVAKKSLSRNDSPNTEITWTDGLHARYIASSGWNSHLILQRSEDDGPTTVRRSPLAFNEPLSHITYYAGMEKKEKQGRYLQRGWDVTVIPEGLRRDGTAAGRIDDYLGITGRLAVQWPQQNGMRFVWAGEAGYAPTTPTNAAVSLPGSGDSDGFAIQTSLNFVDIAPRHSIGLVYGQVGGGWLLSPDFANNQELMEARYQWRLSTSQSIEARVRERRDLEQRIGALEKRLDDDFYVRYTVQF